MARIAENKVTVNVFLNDRLKPEYFGGRIPYYPIYFRVIYEQKSTQIAVSFNEFEEDKGLRYCSIKEFERLENDIERMASYSNIDYSVMDMRALYINIIREKIKDIVLFERKHLKSRFDLKGLGSRASFLFSSLADWLGDQLTVEMQEFFFKTNEAGFASTLKETRPFYVNYDSVLKMHRRSHPFDDDLQHKIELYFMFAAGCEEKPEMKEVFTWVLGNGAHKFESFLLNSDIFNSTVEFKLPLSNFYVRHVSLNPPSINDISFYVNLLLQIANKRVSDYYNLL
jgi:hypothetical protein